MEKQIFSKDCQNSDGSDNKNGTHERVGGTYKIGKWNSILYRYGQSFLSKKLEAYQIGSGQVVYLIHLYIKDGVNQEELADYLKIDKATVAKSLKKLEEGGYVLRQVDAEDRRAYKVFITEKALAIRSSLMADMDNWEKALMDGLSDDEKRMASVLLEKMAQNAFKFHE